MMKPALPTAADLMQRELVHVRATDSLEEVERVLAATVGGEMPSSWPEEALHKEYFTVPEAPDYVNQPFTLALARSGRAFEIPADKRATEVLAENGIAVDTKCSDGICGVCAVPLVSGTPEHRDHVLSKKERERKIILCCSRAAEPGGVVTVEL